MAVLIPKRGRKAVLCLLAPLVFISCFNRYVSNQPCNSVLSNISIEGGSQPQPPGPRAVTIDLQLCGSDVGSDIWLGLAQNNFYTNHNYLFEQGLIQVSGSLQKTINFSEPYGTYQVTAFLGDHYPGDGVLPTTGARRQVGPITIVFTSSVTWTIPYNRTTGNTSLVGSSGGSGSSVTQWESALRLATNLNVRVDSRNGSVAAPPDNTLDWNSEVSFLNYLNVYVAADNSYFSGRSADQCSILIGINQRSFPPEYAGRTLRRNSIAGYQPYAISFVIPEAIWNASGYTNAEHKWRRIQFSVLHELGHARGLNDASDHGTHLGPNSADCPMLDNLLPSELPNNHIFCGRHRKILTQCLDIIQPSYNPGASCAQYP